MREIKSSGENPNTEIKTRGKTKTNKDGILLYALAT